MKQTLSIVALLLGLVAPPVNAATWYFLDTATGAETGTDWANAFTGTGGGLSHVARGDVAYYGSGQYLGGVVTVATSGTTVITFKHATIADHGTSVGWNNAFAAQTLFLNTWDLRTSYLRFDGQTGTGTSGYGFKATNSLVAQEVGAWHVYNGFTASNIELTHIEIVGTGTDTSSGQLTYGIRSQQNGGSTWTVSYCYFHDMYTWAQMYQISPAVFDHCYLQNAGSNSGLHHGDGFAFQGNNFVLKYCVLENMIGSANTTYVEVQGVPTTGAEIYGCVYRSTSSQENTTQWAPFSAAGSSSILGLRFFNNTIYGLHSANPGINAASGGTGQISNNVWQACVNVPTFQGTLTMGQNTLNTGGVNFQAPASGNFHLASPTILWTALPAPYNTDPDGVTRTSSIGAYQYVSGSPLPPNTPVNSSPAAGAVNASLTPTLTTTGYSSPSGIPQGSSLWTVWDSLALSNVWSSGIVGAVTSYPVPPLALSNATTYQWQVQFWDQNGVASSPSLFTSFTTTNAPAPPSPPNTPVNSAPASGATGVSISPTLSIAGYSSPGGFAQTGFQVQVYNGASKVYDSGIQSGALTSWSVPSGNLSFLTAYTFQARVRDSNSILSAWSTPTPFTTIAAPAAGVIQFSASGYLTSETSGSVALTVTRTGGTNGVLTVNYATANVTATSGHDYTAASGTLTFPDGNAISQTVTVTILNSGDTATVNRTFTATLTGSSLGTPTTTTVTIQMNPPLPAGAIGWSQAVYATTQGGGSVTAQGIRFGGSGGLVTAHYATADGTALAGRDYVATSGTVTFATGSTNAFPVPITILNSGQFSNTARTFSLVLSAPTGGASLSGVTTAAIPITMPPIVSTIIFSGKGTITFQGDWHTGPTQ